MVIIFGSYFFGLDYVLFFSDCTQCWQRTTRSQNDSLKGWTWCSNQQIHVFNIQCVFFGVFDSFDFTCNNYRVLHVSEGDFFSFSVGGVGVGVRKASKLRLVHWSQDVLVDWGQLGFLDGESRVKVLDVQDVPLRRKHFKIKVWKWFFLSRVDWRNVKKLTTLGLKGGSISFRSSRSQLILLKNGWSIMSPAEQPGVPSLFWGSFSSNF